MSVAKRIDRRESSREQNVNRKTQRVKSKSSGGATY
jgi:hypothetical protein